MALKILALALLLGATGMAVATTSALPSELETIRVQQAAIRDAVQAGSSPYSELSPEQRQELLQRQAALLQTLGDKQSPDQLEPGERAEVTQSLAWIESKGHKAEDERLVCERIAIPGSHRKERVCKTERQRRLERDAARNAFERPGARESLRGN